MPSAAPMRGRQAHSSTTPTIAGMRIAMKPQYGCIPPRVAITWFTSSDSGG